LVRGFIRPGGRSLASDRLTRLETSSGVYNVTYLERFRVRPDSWVRLKDIDPAFKDHHVSHEAAAKEIAHYQQSR
jgi:hypothetical protein